MKEGERDLGEHANSAFHEDLSEEEIVSQQPLLERTELHQPPQHRRLLQLQKPRHHRAGDSPGLDRRRQVLGQILQRPPSLRQHHQSLLSVLVLRRRPLIASAATSAAAVSIVVVVVVVVSAGE